MLGLSDPPLPDECRPRLQDTADDLYEAGRDQMSGWGSCGRGGGRHRRGNESIGEPEPPRRGVEKHLSFSGIEETTGWRGTLKGARHAFSSNACRERTPHHLGERSGRGGEKLGLLSPVSTERLIAAYMFESLSFSDLRSLARQFMIAGISHRRHRRHRRHHIATSSTSFSCGGLSSTTSTSLSSV